MRVAIVNDMAMAREALRRVTLSVPGYEVAWLAADGNEATELARKNTPDLILMDLVMPVVDGAEATRRIMAVSPCPIIVVTSSVTGNLARVYEAMGHGALDAIDTPTVGSCGTLAGSAPLLKKMAMVAKLKSGRTPPTEPSGAPVEVARATPPQAPSVSPCVEVGPIVVLGSSTGGPNALDEILRTLPTDWKAPIVVIQHVDAAFAGGLAAWLTDRCGRPVTVARAGQPLRPGEVILAATNDHLRIDPDLRLSYTPEPSDACYRPSVDVFFESAAQNWPGNGVAVLLTGMGRDGAQGLLKLRRKGWLTIAQDRPSSVIWGMPRAAIELGAAVRVLPLKEIGRALAEGVSRRASLEKVYT